MAMLNTARNPILNAHHDPPTSSLYPRGGSPLNHSTMGLTSPFRNAFLAVLLLTIPFSLAQNISFSLPPPTGPYTVGTVIESFVDPSRIDPLSPAPQHPRVLVAQLYYPTFWHAAIDHKLSPYVSPRVAEVNEAIFALPPGILNGSVIKTNSYLDAPLNERACEAITAGGRGIKIVIFSPGMGVTRSLYAQYHEELASHGYVVVALDHPYDADIVEAPELPGGEARAAPVEEWPLVHHQVRVDDLLFVLKLLGEEGKDVVMNRLKGNGGEGDKPWRKRARKDMLLKNAKIGVYGHSLGGSAAAGVMIAFQNKTFGHSSPKMPKLLGGINLDGMFFPPAVSPNDLPPWNVTTRRDPKAALPSNARIDKPFLLWGTPVHNRVVNDEPTWPYVYDTVLKQWKRELVLLGGQHMSFTDLPYLAEKLKLKDRSDWPFAGMLDSIFGTVDPTRVGPVVARWTRGFMDWVVKGDNAGERLLDGKAEIGMWPEVEIRR